MGKAQFRLEADGTLRRSGPSQRRIKGRIDVHRVDATTEADIARHAAEDDAAPTRDAANERKGRFTTGGGLSGSTHDCLGGSFLHWLSRAFGAHRPRISLRCIHATGRRPRREDAAPAARSGRGSGRRRCRDEQRYRAGQHKRCRPARRRSRDRRIALPTATTAVSRLVRTFMPKLPNTLQR